MKAKEALIWKSAFLKPSASLVSDSMIQLKIAYTRITIENIRSVLMTQAITKAPGPNKINFQILHII